MNGVVNFGRVPLGRAIRYKSGRTRANALRAFRYYPSREIEALLKRDLDKIVYWLITILKRCMKPTRPVMDTRIDFDDLVDAVDSDQEDSNTKDATKLLVAAMTDWPTLNQTLLTDFIREFKIQFGYDFTLSELEIMTTNDNWKNEAQVSIVNMLKLYPTKSFDEIIDSILAKYFKK